MTRQEAHETLFKGQSNVAQLASQIGVTADDLKESFRAYACLIPMDESVWQGDVEVSWPWC